MVETIPTNTEVQVPVPTGNPFDLVGTQAHVPSTTVNQVAAQTAPTQISAAKPGSTFLDKIMRTIAKALGHPDPFTGQPAPKEGASTPVIPQTNEAPGSTTTPVQAPKTEWFMGGIFSNFNFKDLAATTKLLAGQAMNAAKDATQLPQSVVKPEGVQAPQTTPVAWPAGQPIIPTAPVQTPQQ